MPSGKHSHVCAQICPTNDIFQAAVNVLLAILRHNVILQLRYRTESVNANEIANGVLSALVSITAGCAFVDYWGAVLIGCKFERRAIL